jgi:hypothetical protein
VRAKAALVAEMFEEFGKIIVEHKERGHPCP